MFKGTFQSGFLSLFYSLGSDPLQLWTLVVAGTVTAASPSSPPSITHPSSDPQEAYITFADDNLINSKVLELRGAVQDTYIAVPAHPSLTLGITLPFLVLLVKPFPWRHFSFEIALLDDSNVRRRFRFSTFQSAVRSKPGITTIPLLLEGNGNAQQWHQIVLDLKDLMKRTYGTQFQETLSIQVHANVRIRRIYFAEKLLSDDDLPAAFKLYHA